MDCWQPATRLPDPSVMRVETWMPAADLPRLRVGEPAWVSLEAEPQVRLRATVSEIAEAPIDSTKGTVYRQLWRSTIRRGSCSRE
jgi:multidrug resistance efflux pump